ncbi:MAG: N-acetylmuramoyl-L-alanine amidase [Bacteroidota bacterium]
MALIICWMGGIALIHAESSYDTLSFDFQEALPPSVDNTNFIRTSKGLTPFSPESPAVFSSASQKVPVSTAGPFVAMSAYTTFEHLDPQKVLIKYSTSANGNSWSAFENFPQFDHLEVGVDTFISELVFLPRDVQFIRFEIQYNPSGTAGKSVFYLQNLRLDFFQPGNISPAGTKLNESTEIRVQQRKDSCSCKIPPFVTRVDWDNPDGRDYSGNLPSFAPVTHNIIHHSAGSNTSNDWAAVVLSIWNFHTASIGSGGRGWDDIGYNWLIDPNGVIYEGRGGGNNVVGAHFCGSNTGTMGVCLLGTFENTAPTPQALASLKNLLAWKFCDSRNDPLATTFHSASGLNLPTISGQKVGCSTLCPGAMLEGELGQLRQNVAEDTLCRPINTSIIDWPEETAFKLYPNPSNGNFTIQYTQALPGMNQLIIRDIQGRPVWDRAWLGKSGKKEEAFSLSMLPSGIYIAQFMIGQTPHSQKIIIQD